MVPGCRLKADADRFDALEQAVTSIAEQVGALNAAIAGFSTGAGKPDAQLAGKVDQLSADLGTLRTTLETTGALPKRPKSDGNGQTFTATDC